MFDTQAEFEIKILSDGEKRCKLRWPTDEEWCQRAGAQRTVRRNLGRSKATYEIRGLEAATLELFRKIRLDADGPEFNEAEAVKAVARLERCTVTEVERQGDQFRLALKVPGADVVHVLKIPNQADVLQFSRASVHSVEGRRESNIRVTLEPAGVLWDKIQVSTEGYANGVPIIHREVAVTELLAELNAAEDDDEDPN